MSKIKTHWNVNNPYNNKSMKICPSCKLQLKRSAFSLDKKRNDGLQCYCKLCSSKAKDKLRSGYNDYWENHDPYLNKTLKICDYCNTKLNRKKFYKNYSVRDGLDNKCKECSVKTARHRHVQNPIKQMFRKAKLRAQDKNMPFTIKIEELVMPDRCPILGIKLKVSKGIVSHNSPSLDRIDNNKGYVSGNVHIISYRANSIKMDASITELENLLLFLYSIKN